MKKNTPIIVFIVTVLGLTGLVDIAFCSEPPDRADAAAPSPNIQTADIREGGKMALSILSPAFAPGGDIPALYTCDGKDISVPLELAGVPEGAQTLVLIVDDPDAPDPAAPKMTWIHWLLYNLPADTALLPEAVPDSGLPSGTLQGANSWHRTGYGGPCPPIGRHRYFFKLYALDIVLPDLNEPEKDALLKAMNGHVLGDIQMIGTYQH